MHVFMNERGRGGERNHVVPKSYENRWSKTGWTKWIACPGEIVLDKRLKLVAILLRSTKYTAAVLCMAGKWPQCFSFTSYFLGIFSSTATSLQSCTMKNVVSTCARPCTSACDEHHNYGIIKTFTWYTQQQICHVTYTYTVTDV